VREYYGPRTADAKSEPPDELLSRRNHDSRFSGSSNGAADKGGGNEDNDENAVAATIRAILEAVCAYQFMQFVVHFARSCNELMWCSQLDPRFSRMRFLPGQERGQQCQWRGVRLDANV
jgi:hypothetical protein